jgi:hypothetical protein
VLSIEENGLRVEIAVPVRDSGAALGAPLLLLTLFGIAAAYFEIGRRAFSGASLVGNLLIAGCVVGSLLALWMLLFLVFGRQVLRADGEWLEVRSELFGLARVRRFPMADVPDFSFEMEDRASIVFFVGKHRVSFGGAFTPLEQTRVKLVLQSHLNRLRPRLR